VHGQTTGTWLSGRGRCASPWYGWRLRGRSLPLQSSAQGLAPRQRLARGSSQRHAQVTSGCGNRHGARMMRSLAVIRHCGRSRCRLGWGSCQSSRNRHRGQSRGGLHGGDGRWGDQLASWWHGQCNQCGLAAHGRRHRNKSEGDRDPSNQELAKDSPSSSSITMQVIPLWSMTSKTLTTLG
jgi:hypothetical protein